MAVSIENIKEYVKFWTDKNHECSPINENIIAFIGPTKGGKSTLINCLMKKRLLCRECEETEERFIVKAEERDGGPQIGIAAESQSLKPECYGNFGNTDLLMWDFPGFGDNKGVKQEVANAISVKTVLCKQNSVRFILVVPFNIIKQSDPFEFIQLLNSILNISPDIAKHLILVASKMEKGNLKVALDQLLNLPFPNADSERLSLIEKAKSVVKVLLENDAFLDFKSPVVENDELYVLSNKENFRESLIALDGINISDCNLVISNKAQLDILKLYDIVYNCLRLEIGDIVSDIKSKAEGKVVILNNPATRPAEVIDFGRKEIDEYRKILNDVTNLKDLLLNVGSPERRRNAIELCDNFENLESLRNSCGQNALHGEREFSLLLRNELNSAILMLNEGVERIDPNMRLVTVEERSNMISLGNESRLVSMANLRNIGSSIIDFFRNNGPMIRSTLNFIFSNTSIIRRIVSRR